MARAIWTGSISFGLVNIPVGLYSAVSEKTIRFHQLERGTSDRVRNKRVNENTGEEVEYSDIVKGYDVGGGQYVVLTPQELEAAEPTGTRTIEIDDFVDEAEIDPIFYNQTYYVAPRTDAASRPYALLLEAMRQSGKTAIATFVMRSKEHLAAVRVDGDILALETMYFADEIRDPAAEIEVRPGGEPPKERELTTAISLIESMSAKWEPEKYHDRYRARVEELIEAKLAGQEVVTGRPKESDTNVVDLMEALRRSVDRVRQGRGEAIEEQKAPATRTKRAAAKKTTTKSEPTTAKPAAKKKGRQPQGEQLSMMSREELYQLAQDINLPGRSKMNRDELEEAVASAQAARRAS
jgi:DNA end-binding protein Ku